ncbi:protein LTO1 homolog isoform X1 [Microtus pennsylvanicus]|uniref:protein LTO1 homolog isoform X1 n=1 Tax=Microtus pennsylvanicus TaxID=10058 RepID=UPI003F6AF3D4
MAGVREPGENRAAAMAVEQDMFDAVVMADERFHGEGYQEGYEEGSSLGIVEGRQYGTLQGAKIGSEIGCYRGFALAWKCLLHSGACEKDRRLITDCSTVNETRPRKCRLCRTWSCTPLFQQRQADLYEFKGNLVYIGVPVQQGPERGKRKKCWLLIANQNTVLSFWEAGAYTMAQTGL